MKKNRILCTYVTLVLAIVFMTANCYAFDYSLSEDFNKLDENAGGYHKVRLYGVASETTTVKINSISPFNGSPDIEAVLTGSDYKDWILPTGAKISTDKPVVAIKYNASHIWDANLLGAGTSLNVNSSSFFMVASSSDATEVSVDLDLDGSPDSFNLNSGYAAIGWVGSGKTISSSQPVHIFTFEATPSEIKDVYLLTPGSSAYVPLVPIIPNADIDDSNSTGIPEAHLNLPSGEESGTALNWFIAQAKKALSQVSSFLVSEAHAAATTENNVDNGNGTFTFTQKINRYSTAPHYTTSRGFGYYIGRDADFGWKHMFPYSNQAGLQIQSATLTIRAYDVDSEPWRGTGGEYDGVKGDGTWLNPQYLQGTNGRWSLTNFNIDSAALSDGELDVWVDIDMMRRGWLTNLDYSTITIVYSFTNNNPPFSPALSISPTGCTNTTDNLAVNVTGPNPADQDGDSVRYEYRWLVDVGTGSYIDDEFAGRHDHTGNTVPASDTRIGDRWKVEVTPIDQHNAKGTKNSVSFATIGSCNTPPIADAGGNQEVNTNTSFSLDGSASYDTDGTITTYKWELYSGGSWSSIGTSASISYTLTSAGNYTVRLTVTDNQGATDDSLAYIKVLEAPTNQPPVADAGSDQTVEQTGPSGAQVSLDGSGSSDPDGDPLAYTWSGPFGTATGTNPTLTIPPGISNANLVVNDGTVNSTSDTVIITVQDTTAPVITVNSDVYIEATDVLTTVDLSGTATATDAVGVVSLTNDATAAFPLSSGTSSHKVTWTATDAAGNTSTAFQYVYVQDTTSPVITLLETNIIVEATGLLTTVDLSGTATATDALGVVSLSNNAPTEFAIGTTPYAIEWTAVDSSGNVGVAIQTVTVQDTTPPVITASDVLVEATGYSTVVDLNSTISVTDITGVNMNSLDHHYLGGMTPSFHVGTTVLTWTVEDNYGNIGTATQNITVVDTTPPALTLPDNQMVEAASENGAIGSYALPTADDIADPSPMVSCTPTSGSTFSIGATTVNCSATDATGNTSNGSLTINVVDTTAPVVTAPADATAEATGVQSAVATGSATATDVVGIVSLTSNAPATFPVGLTVVTWTATDAAGNVGTATQNVTVADTTAPIVTAPADVTVTLTGALTSVATGSATAIDAVGVVSLSSNAPTAFPVGTTVVIWMAVDAAGNVGTATQNVAVVYDFGGLLAPVNHDKPFKLGRTIPVKFQLTDEAGGYVSTAVATISLQKFMNDEPSGDSLEGLSTSSADTDNTFRYDETSEQYIFNLNTKGLSQGTWLLSIELNDGSIQTIFIKIKK